MNIDVERILEKVKHLREDWKKKYIKKIRKKKEELNAKGDKVKKDKPE